MPETLVADLGYGSEERYLKKIARLEMSDSNHQDIFALTILNPVDK